MRETKRQYRILRISAEHNTCVRITDEVSLLNWIPSIRSATLEQNENWSEDGESQWCTLERNLGFIRMEEGINSPVKRRIQGLFVGQHDRTRAIRDLVRRERVFCWFNINPLSSFIGIVLGNSTVSLFCGFDFAFDLAAITFTLDCDACSSFCVVVI